MALNLSNIKNNEEFNALINALGERLQKEKNDVNSTIICYIISKNVEKLSKIYFEQIQKYNKNSILRNQLLIASI